MMMHLVSIMLCSHVGHHVEHVLKALRSPPNTTRVNASFYNDAITDHYDSVLSKRWSQRFYVDARFWCGTGCPVFLYIGGEGPQSAPSPHLFMWTLAQKHGALMLALEHRFYGESRPTADMSRLSLRLLTSEQALEDLAAFIGFVNGHDPARGPDHAATPPLALNGSTNASTWVTFGGSYPGSLATWLKLKYPFLTRGTVGSSAPVYAKYDFSEYAQVVGAALANPAINGSTACVGVVSSAVSDLATVVAPLPAPLPKLPPELMPCSPLRTALDLATYFATIFSAFQGAVQYNMQGRPPYVADVCAVLLAERSAPLDALARAMRLFKAPNATADESCVASSFQQDTAAPLSDTSFSPRGCDLRCRSDRQWIWQSCNEFGYFQSAAAAKQPFSTFAAALNVSTAGAAICEAAFGFSGYDGPPSDARGWLLANREYGGRRVEGINVTMPTGSMDPWHALGVVLPTDPWFQAGNRSGDPAALQDLRACSRPTPVTAACVSVVELSGTAHCRDMYAPNAFVTLDPPLPDPPSVTAAHTQIAADVARYVGPAPPPPPPPAPSPPTTVSWAWSLPEEPGETCSPGTTSGQFVSTGGGTQAATCPAPSASVASLVCILYASNNSIAAALTVGSSSCHGAATPSAPGSPGAACSSCTDPSGYPARCCI